VIQSHSADALEDVIANVHCHVDQPPPLDGVPARGGGSGGGGVGEEEWGRGSGGVDPGLSK
jgi:hypothetical protein